MKVYRYPERNRWPELLKRPLQDIRSLFPKIREMLDEIKIHGDEALSEYTLKFDKVALDYFEIGRDIIVAAGDRISEELKQAMNFAAGNIQMFHEKQKSATQKIDIQTGVTCWQKSVPIEKIGLYIPGGTAPLFSTVLMLAIPARIAGCREIILCTPPDRNGNVNPAILYAAYITGVTRVFRLGGVQAIGAMAYGTKSVPKVYKIFGPGNQYVTAAKQLVTQDTTAIDLPAGPSEVAVMADNSANPLFVASDLLSQAEHGIDSQVILFTTDEGLIGAVQTELKNQLSVLPRKILAAKALENSRIFLMRSMDEMIEITNEYAPEHLIISTENAEQIAEKIMNAGSVFIGNYAPESAGDYVSGTNHTLPTNGFARVHNGVNLDFYVKKITFQKISKEGLEKISRAIVTMAESEELTAHGNAVNIRLK